MDYIYRNTTLGKTLQESLEKLMQSGAINPPLALKVIASFDKSIKKALSTSVNSRLNFKAQNLKAYRFCDNAWQFKMEGVEFRENDDLVTAVEKLKIVACDVKAPPSSASPWVGTVVPVAATSKQVPKPPTKQVPKSPTKQVPELPTKPVSKPPTKPVSKPPTKPVPASIENFSSSKKKHEAASVGAGGKIKKHQCSVCAKAYEKRRDLIIHERSHTGETPFVCTVCGTGVSTKGSLIKHYRSHTGEKPYSCADCGARFVNSSNLGKHRKFWCKGQK